MDGERLVRLEAVVEHQCEIVQEHREETRAAFERVNSEVSDLRAIVAEQTRSIDRMIVAAKITGIGLGALWTLAEFVVPILRGG